jgi:hypothetical protein
MISKKNALVAAKIETAYGVAATLTATEAMFVSDFTHKMIEGDVVERNNILGTLGAQGSVRVSQHDMIEFSVELAGSGAAGVAPRYSPLLKACGFSEVVTASTNVVYAPVSSGFNSLTIGVFYKDDAGNTMRQLITGARGSVTLEMSAGGLPTLKFSFTGLYNDPASATALTGDFSSIPVPKGVNKANTPSVSFYGETLPTGAITINPGIEVKYRNLINLESVDILDRKGSLSLELDMPTTTDATAWVVRGKNNDLGALSVTHGTTAGNIVAVSVPNVQLKTVSPSYDGVIMRMSCEGDIVPLTPNSDLTITLT